MADSEKTKQSTSSEKTTNEDISNANNNMANASSPVEDKSSECKTVGNNNWWGSWINSAKTKSVSVFEAVKRDLDEISTAVRTEVSHAGTVLNDTLKLDEPESTASTVKKSLSSFFGQVSEALVPSIEDDESEAIIITSEGAVTLTGFQKHLAELQANEATFLSPPDATLQENYQRWLECVDQDQFTQNQLARHLTSSEILNEKYLRLVPDKLPHMDFWKHYLFKRALLEDALAHAEMAERRAKAEIRSTKTVSPKRAGEIIQTEQPKTVQPADEKDEAEEQVESAKIASDELIIEDSDIKWDADDFGNEEISEEEQARLLEQYEAEIMEREKRKSQVVPLEEKIRTKTDTKSEQPKAGNKKDQQKTQPTSQKGANASKKSNTTKSNSTTSKQVDNSKTKSNAKSKQTAQNSGGDDAKKSASKKNQGNDKGDTTVVKERSLAEDLKTDTGAASDESWEKDFDLSDQ
ncbi:BSD domain-containing protein 1-like isoform X2 [Sitodiplosis mosellana]|uniref:BSD domain-containing protein 1-like isoform X2 n=1 Tax=Sitodiplosis mosellana TaxID=263140 RepID=UPI002444A1E0|nr:BSD domain-containing protein 1-like isoform X2 [Sitodiplosis mosellana]